jgi:DNA (cytosine-5)-methyltransferase 1
MLNGLDLFSGIGGLTRALSDWVRPLAYCENDRYAQAVLLSRMGKGDLPVAPIWDDVRTLRGHNFMDRHSTAIDIISGGFPCQDISCAGNGVGLEGERSSLFFEIIRLCSELRPRFVFLENVPAISIRGLDRVLLEFTALGYDSRWTIVSAGELGADHLRERWFLLAHANGERLERLEPQKISRKTKSRNTCLSLPRAWSSSDSGFVRISNELPRPMDQVRALGNAVVPIQAREAFERLCGLNDS